MEQNIIYTYGGGEVLYYVFNGIAAILGGSDKDSTLMQVFKIASAVGGFWAIVSIVIRNNLMVGIHWFMWFLLATELIFMPKVTVYIKDPVNRYKNHIDNVPFGLAFVAGSLSQFGHIMTEKMEQNFSLPNDFKYHKTGSVFASRLLSSMDKVRITDADFAETMHNFVNQCIVLSSRGGPGYTIEDLRTEKNLWELVGDNASEFFTFSYKDPNTTNPPELISCADGAVKLEKDLTSQIRRATLGLTKINLPDFIASALADGHTRDGARAKAQNLLKKHLFNTFKALKTESDNAEAILKQQMMINAIIDGSSNKLLRIGGNSNYATAKAMLQQRNTYSIMGVLAKSLPMVRTVFEALIYGAFVFVILLSLLPGGHKILFNYFQTIAWLQLWAPLNAILNLIITVTAKSRTQDLLGDGGGMTIANSAGIIQLNEDMCSYAMYLSMLIPFIAIALVRGVSSFVQLASHIGSGYQAAAASVAGDVTSGNISLGNISHRMRSMESTQMFQHNLSPSFNMGQHKEILSDGAEKITNLDGSTVYRAGAGNTSSILPVNIKASDALSSQFTENIHKEESATASRNKEFAQQESIATKRLAEIIERATIAQSSGTSYDLSHSTTHGKALQNAVDMTKKVEERFGLTTRQAAQMVAGMSVSGSAGVSASATPKSKILGGSIGAFLGPIDVSFGGSLRLDTSLGLNYTTDATREQTTSEVEDYVKKSGYNENLDTVVKATKDIRFGESQSEDKTLTEGLSSNHETMKSLRQSNSISEQNIDKYNKGIAYIKSHGFAIDRDLAQPFLEYLATREEQGRPIGKETARKMISMWGEDAKTYFGYFIRDKQDEVLEKANASIAVEKTKIAGVFDKTSVGSIEPQKAFEEVYSKAQEKGVTPNVVQHKELKDKVESKLQDADIAIEQRRFENVLGMENKQNKVDANYKKNLLVSAAGKIGSTKKDKK